MERVSQWHGKTVHKRTENVSKRAACKWWIKKSKKYSTAIIRPSLLFSCTIKSMYYYQYFTQQQLHFFSVPPAAVAIIRKSEKWLESTKGDEALFQTILELQKGNKVIQAYIGEYPEVSTCSHTFYSIRYRLYFSDALINAAVYYVFDHR